MSVVSSPMVVRGNTVLPGLLPLSSVSYAEALQVTLGSTTPLEAYSRKVARLISPKEGRYSHGFVAAVHAAYTKHFPLTLTPDMIWLLIAQGLAIHVRENADALREKLVAHAGKLCLTVQRPQFVKGFAGNDWEGVLAELSEQLGRHSSLSSPTFSTTGMVEKAAFDIALLDTLQHYFNDETLTICGIPKFYLEGTLADWQALRRHAESLSALDLDLDWWLAHLLPVLDELVAAASGSPNPAFWTEFYGDESCQTGTYVCGMTGFMGHIVNFFPYKVETPPIPGSRAEEYFSQYPATTRNNSLGKRIGKLTTVTSPTGGRHYETAPDQFRWGEVFSDTSLPSSVSQAPFTWVCHEKRYPMTFLAGFIGASQDKKTRAIRPEIGWAVRDASPSG